MTTRKHIKRLFINPVLFFTVLAFFISPVPRMGQSAHAEAIPVIGIAWCDAEQDYSWEKVIVEEAGAQVVVLSKITAPALTYDDAGTVGAEWIYDSGALRTETAEIVKQTAYAETNVENALEGIDAVIFFGGDDISPSLYSHPQEVANHGEEYNATRDVSDYILMSYCIDKNIPVFGICRGMQVLGVVAGCDFVQDITDYYASLGLVDHQYHRISDDDDADFAYHDVSIRRESLMYDIVGADVLRNVSSWHHQAMISTEGSNLTATAFADCGGVRIIEAIELQTNGFCLGVQFHPEIVCGNVLNEGMRKEDVNNYDSCLRFFQSLVEYSVRHDLSMAS